MSLFCFVCILHDGVSLFNFITYIICLYTKTNGWAHKWAIYDNEMKSQ